MSSQVVEYKAGEWIEHKLSLNDIQDLKAGTKPIHEDEANLIRIIYCHPFTFMVYSRYKKALYSRTMTDEKEFLKEVRKYKGNKKSFYFVYPQDKANTINLLK